MTKTNPALAAAIAVRKSRTLLKNVAADWFFPFGYRHVLRRWVFSSQQRGGLSMPHVAYYRNCAPTLSYDCHKVVDDMLVGPSGWFDTQATLAVLVQMARPSRSLVVPMRRSDWTLS